MSSQRNHNPFRVGPATPTPTGTSVAPSFHSSPGIGESTVTVEAPDTISEHWQEHGGSSSGNTQRRAHSSSPPPLPPRRPPMSSSGSGSTPTIPNTSNETSRAFEDEPPAYTPSPSTYQGETTLEYGPRRPFQQTPVQPPQQLYAPPQIPQQQYLSAPANASSPSPSPSPTPTPSPSSSLRWLNDITRNPAVHQMFNIARQVTGDIQRELRNLDSSRSSAPPQTQQHPVPSPPRLGIRSISAGPVIPPPPAPPPPTQLTPQSDFARDFYAAGTGEGELASSSTPAVQGDPRGPQAYAPPSGPPPPSSSPSRIPHPIRRWSRSVEDISSRSSIPPNDGRPTTTPIPGHPLLHDGKILMYPKNHFCQKCQNTGYKQFDPSHPCKKCWGKYAKSYDGAISYVDFSSRSASDSSSKSFQRPLPSFGGSLSTISAASSSQLPDPNRTDNNSNTTRNNIRNSQHQRHCNRLEPPASPPHRRTRSLSDAHRSGRTTPSTSQPRTPPPLPPRSTNWTPMNGSPQEGFGGPMRPWSSWVPPAPSAPFGPPIPQIRPPLPPRGPSTVVAPGDPRMGGTLCPKCHGRGMRDHWGGLVADSCSMCNGVGRIF